MRLLLTFGCVATCLAIGGRLAWNALELGDWTDDSSPWSISSLMTQTSEPAPGPESTTVLIEDSLVPRVMLPKVEVPDRLNKPTRSSFGSRGLPSGRSTTIQGGIVVPPNARAGSNKSISQSSSSGVKAKIGAYESAPGQAYGFNRYNPLSTALNSRNYVKPRFNFTSESRKQSNGNTSRKPTRSTSRAN